MEQSITLKHLCREFDLDPYTLRQYLRKNLTSHTKHRRWKWQPDDPELTTAKKLAQQLKDKSNA
jgi:hypothetical protein